MNSTSSLLHKPVFYQINVTEANVSLVFHVNVPPNTSVHLLLQNGTRPTKVSHTWSASYSNLINQYVVIETLPNTVYFLSIEVNSSFPNDVGRYLDFCLEYFIAGCFFWNEKLNEWQNGWV